MPDFGIFRGFNDKLFGNKLYAGQLPTQLGLIGSTNFSPFLLDQYLNSVVAYSLRLLRKDYIGNAIRVRRSSDNTEQNIGFVNNVLDTSSLLSFCGSGNGFITTWYDQSGNGYNLTQSFATNQPQIVNSGSLILENNKPTIDFASKFIATSAFSSSISQPNTYFITINKTNHNGYLFETTGTARQAQGDGSWIFAGTVANDFYPTADLGSQKLLTILFNGANSISRINSTQKGSGNPGNNGQGGISIGRSSQPLTGKLQEFIMFSANQTSNFVGIESNINTYYGIY